MITIPIWVFVILVVLAGFTALGILFVVICVIAAVLFPVKEYDPTYEEENCPYEMESDNPDYNPEHIPLEREHKDD